MKDVCTDFLRVFNPLWTGFVKICKHIYMILKYSTLLLLYHHYHLYALERSAVRVRIS